MLDITIFKPADKAFMHLKSPANEQPLYDGEGKSKKAAGITFHAPGSPTYEAASADRVNRALVRSKKKSEITAQTLVDDQVEFLTAITASFDHFNAGEGEQQGEDTYRAVYSDRKFGWLTDQANAFIGDWENFLPK